MRRAIILFFVAIVTLPAYSQIDLQDGDRCFDSGDYECATKYYKELLKLARGREKQVAEIKLTRAKWCSEHIKTANRAFASGNYLIAKEEYQKVLDSNPKDSYVQLQMEKCDRALDRPELRKATAADLADIWDDKYGVNPQRRQNLINAGIDPDDAQRRINAGEGKPQEKEATYLRVSKSTLYFTSYSETSEQIKVNSNASLYSIPRGFVPSWCTVNTYSGYFTVTVSANPHYTSRKDWFKIIADDKEVRINVEQLARKKPVDDKKSNSQKSISTQKQVTKNKVKKCFNCPKSYDTWGITLGYTQQAVGYQQMDVIQFGLKVEPLYKYGFGLNTGIYLLGYSENVFGSRPLKNGFDFYAVNIPLQLEYRLNFSRGFNVFFYGGGGFNAVFNPYVDDYTLPVTVEYGGGFRINRIQFNVGSSKYLGSLKNTQNFGENIETYQKLIVSVSHMF